MREDILSEDNCLLNDEHDNSFEFELCKTDCEDYPCQIVIDALSEFNSMETFYND